MKTKSYQMVVVAVSIAIMVLMAFTPIGLIDLPLIKATTLHIPVIVISLLLGPIHGMALGGVFGILSLIKNTMMPSVLSFVFTPAITVPGTNKGSLLSLVIVLLPRILVGLTPWLFYVAFKKRENVGKIKNYIVLVISSLIGSFTNTILVMGLIYLLFGQEYMAVRSLTSDGLKQAILLIISTNGVAEAIATAIIVPFIVMALSRIQKAR